ncbi:hypothetical protein [Qipengyuania soli]|uniref:Aspartate-semialdehyde dehydrogenase n=1 Tax=Qipengyuania soli TaxID=2782568 RepID=A0A7S8IWP4_9SPHN|nr:hypothetical protein [Qipengyuania soli]QPD00247.1 hypothetical protein IRL76_06910 [Qipengyuania soli]
MNKKAILLALPLALAACGKSEPAPSPSGSVETASPDAQRASDRLSGAKIVLDANGLGAKGGIPLRFGATRTEVDALAAKSFGAEGEKSSNGECGAGPMDFSQYGPLQVAYLDGKFAGWFLRTGGGVVTSDGIRPGITMDALKGERQVREIESTLPGEFEYTTADYGTIMGFAEGGKITSLAAGVTCFFR